jgi:thiol-disulfide isomerase/thioredoxin/tetratricopeptide (TPR) repeat protein
MKKTFVILFTLLLYSQIFAQEAGIAFEQGTWNDLLAKAKQTHKLVFVDAYTSWCGPCKWMSHNVFPNAEVGALYNAHFISAKIDMEKREGPAIGEKYGVLSYPTSLFLDGDGNLLHSVAGFMPVPEFLALGREVLDPDFASLLKMSRRFAAGERDRSFLKDYLLRLGPGSEDFNAIMEHFAVGMQGAGLLDANSWAVYQTHSLDLPSEYTDYLLAHRTDFERKFGLEVAQAAAGEAYAREGARAARKNDTLAFEKVQRMAAESGLVHANAIVYQMDIRWYEAKQDIPHYLQAVKRLFRTSGDHLDEKRFQAMIVGRACDKKKDLRLALKSGKDVLRQEETYIVFYSLAQIYFKLGNTQQGMDWAEKALAAAKAEGEDPAMTQAIIAQYGSAGR